VEGLRRWLIIGPVVVVAFDTLASVAARTFAFDYRMLWPVGIILAVSVAFLAAWNTGQLLAGVLAGFALEFTNATIGWAISWLIGPGAPEPTEGQSVTVMAVLVVVIVVTASGLVEGVIGGWFGARLRRRRALHAIT
jgi:hypothetical protein